MTFPEIETERLILTELQSDDEAAVFDLFSDQSVIEYCDLEVFTGVRTGTRPDIHVSVPARRVRGYSADNSSEEFRQHGRNMRLQFLKQQNAKCSNRL